LCGLILKLIVAPKPLNLPSCEGVGQKAVRFFLIAAAGFLGWASPARVDGQNPIVTENALTGNLPSEWDVSGVGDASIQGYATDISVNKGQTISFKIKTTASAYRIDIYRLGYYGGRGARKVATVNPSVSLPQNQPTCVRDSSTGLADCGNWAVSASWAVPSNATSGVYIARPVRTDNNGASHIIFVVRDDAGNSDILLQTSDTTWHAYNLYGGADFYTGDGPVPGGRSRKVSYNRPFDNRANPNTGALEGFLWNSEYPMIRWLEANGYNVSYATGVDTDRRGVSALTSHKIFVSIGHDEYWSGQQRANVEALRAAGKNIAFFSGNLMFWRTRWEDSIAGATTPYRTLVCYKETWDNGKSDPSPEWTGTWRDPRFSPPAIGGGSPENALAGTLFMVDAFRADPITISSAEGKLRFWRNTGLDTLADGTTAQLPAGVLGYEWDEAPDNGFRPGGLIQMSTSVIGVNRYEQDYGSTFTPGVGTHHLTLYRHSSGALVFSAGTTQWSWGLDATHDRPGTPVDSRMKQATVNLFADMGVQPATLQSGLVAASQSSDFTPPTSTIQPPPGGTVLAGTTVKIIGTATDSGGGKVAAVEFSLDGGTTWHPATGTTNWTATWNATTPGPVAIKSRATDDSGRTETPGPGITIYVAENSGGVTLWTFDATPTIWDEPDNSAVELGVRFQSDENGFIKALRFYKNTANTGTHVGNLWRSDGTLLASVTFTNETAFGWQQQALPSPVAITAGTTYIASYHTNTGHYPLDIFYFTGRSVDRPPLHAPADNPSAPNGVYHFGASAFPTSTSQASNYWVDVVYVSSLSADTTAPTVTSVSPPNGATGVSTLPSVSAQFSEAMAPWTMGLSNYTYSNPNGQFAFSPPLDSAHQNMLSDFKTGKDLQFTLTQVPNGTYDVYIWTFEDNNPLTATISLEGQVVGTYTSGLAGSWKRLGPFTATINDGNILVRFQCANDVALVSGLEVWAAGPPASPPTPGPSTFYRAINLGGPAMTMDGHNWEANTSATPNLLMNISGDGNPGGNADQSTGFVFNPSVDTPEHATMLRDYRWNHDIQLSLTSLPSGPYDVYVWTFEDDVSTSVALSIDQNTVLPNYINGPPGHWERLGPFSVLVNDGNVQVRFACNDAGAISLLSGIELWQAATVIPTPAGTFYRAINVGGPAMVIDGHNWEAETTSNYTTNVDANPFSLRDSQSNLVASTVTYDPSSQTLQLKPTSALNSSSSYTATVKGGLTGVSDIAGNRLATDKVWSFTTGSGTQPQAATPTFSPPAGTYSSAQSVAISDTSAGTQIYYTTDGSTPTIASTLYTTPISVTTTTTIKAIAAGTGWTTSAVGSATYTIQLSSPPTAPSALNATASSATQTNLTWSDNSSNETSFLIERKTGAGGTYSQIATTPTNVASYSDTSVSASTTYVYRVRASNSAGNSAYSNETTVTTPAVGALPPPWSHADIGGTSLGGSATYSSGTFTVKASGDDIWNAADAFHFVYQPMSGDGTVVTRVASLTNTNVWAKAGVMIRESLGSNSKHAMMVVTPGSGVSFQRRLSTGGASTSTTSTGKAPPYWVGLVRSGNTFTAYYSSNGSTWTQIGSDTISMSANVQVGLAVTSHNNSALTTAVMDSITVQTTIAAPSALAAAATSSTQINLSWTDNANNETGFKIERKTGSGGTYAQIATAGANVTAYSDTGLTPATTYFYRVRATNGSSDSAYSAEASATTPAIPLPAAPSGLTATTATSAQISLAWTDNASNETGFKIERKTGSGGTYSQIATVGAGVVSYSSTGLDPNTTYFYRVRATNAGGDSAYSNEASATTLDAPPAAPSGLAATTISTTQINLSWTDNATNETGFKIERKTGSGGTYAQIATVGAGVTGYNDTGLTASTTYYYRVRATNSLGDSPYSNEANATTSSTIPTAPSNLTVTAASSSQINLAWTDNSTNETGFKIERKTGSAGTYAQIATVGTGVTGYSDTSVAAATTYFYRVRATNAAGDSAYSSEASTASLAAPAFRSAASKGAGSGVLSLTINKPTGTVPGDVMVASISFRPNTATITVPSGWTLIRRIDNANTNPNSLAIYRKAAGSSEPTTYTWSFNTSVGSAGGIQTFTGVDTTTPIDVEAGQNTANDVTIAAPSITTTRANDMIVTSHAFSSSATFTKPSGMTEAFDVASEAVPSSSGESIEGNYQLQAAIGATGTRTATASGDSDAGNAHALALRGVTATAVPFAPGNLTATAVSTSQINLSWLDNGTNETGFKIERKTGAGGTYAQIATVAANVTTYNDTGLTAGTTYFYRVRASSASGDSPYSSETSATTLTAIPSAPSGLAATAVSSTQINLSWTDNSSNETGFKIERKTGSAGTYAEIATVGAGVTSYSNTGLTASTNYFYRVRATNAAGDSAYSNEANTTTLTTPPNAPTGLGATAVSSSQIDLSWTDVANETGYKIERKTGVGGTYTQIASVAAGVVTYSNTGLTVNTTYYYRVRATNAGGDSPYSNEANATTFDDIPAAPSGLGATAVSTTQINLSWGDNAPNETGFKIERKTGAGGTYAEITTVGANVTSYNDTGLSDTTTYYYRVRATNAIGDSSYSNEANATTFTPVPAAPSDLSATAISSSQIDLSWTDNSSNETGFKIERKTGSGGTYSQVATVGAGVTTYSDTALIVNTTYYYRVRATNSGGDSPYSGEANATTLNVIPPAPSNLMATAVSTTQINLSWTSNSVNETGFKIERKTGSGGTYSEIATVGAGVTTYNNTGLTANTTYFYRVRATNAVGDSGYSNEANATTQITLPAAPTGLAASSVSTSQINLTWTDNSGNETGFKIERKTGSGGTYAQIATVGASVTTYSNTGLTVGTTYFYRVRATNSGGDSAYSNEASATTRVSIWPDTATPAVLDQMDGVLSTEEGVRFISDRAGWITSLRFYKCAANTGTHIGHLWTNTGTLLATVTFTNETASGWQQQDLPTPIAISANTPYVASYYSQSRHFSYDDGYFVGQSHDQPPLHALADGVSGRNGIWHDSASAFPTDGNNGVNLWVDVVFADNP
jgi:transcriptional regulator CtsR/regulation of enolase protein 1 (concanavalin A-like superfamily)